MVTLHSTPRIIQVRPINEIDTGILKFSFSEKVKKFEKSLPLVLTNQLIYVLFMSYSTLDKALK